MLIQVLTGCRSYTGPLVGPHAPAFHRIRNDLQAYTRRIMYCSKTVYQHMITKAHINVNVCHNYHMCRALHVTRHVSWWIHIYTHIILHAHVPMNMHIYIHLCLYIYACARACVSIKRVLLITSAPGERKSIRNMQASTIIIACSPWWHLYDLYQEAKVSVSGTKW